ncbi:MAG: hypothetical protein O2913_10495 [Chloroflexi bacterium]|nr:hypothetical protein [Chloroflexota bacterium]
MASSMIIKERIRSIVTTYPLWTIGSTIDPGRKEIEVGNPTGWQLFEANSDQVAKNVESHFVARGMRSDIGRRVSGANYVFIFMGLKADQESSKLSRPTWTSEGLSGPKTLSQYERYLADFKTMYGDRQDYHFLRDLYSRVVSERDPDCSSVPELLSILYGRLEALGIDVEDLAYSGTNKAPSILPNRKPYGQPMSSQYLTLP